MRWYTPYRLNPTQAQRAIEMFRAFPDQEKVEEALKEIITQFGRWDRVVYICRLYRAILADKYSSEIGEKLTKRYSIYQVDNTPYDADELEVFIEDLKHFIGNAEVQNYAKILSFTFEEQDPKEILQAFQKLETDYQEQRKDKYIPLDAGKLLISFPDGFEWVFLNKNYCEKEGQAMGHCGNSGGRSDPDQKILSLREPTLKGMKPRLTFIFHQILETPEGPIGYLGEMKGPRNAKPKKELHPYIIELLKLPSIEFIFGGGYAVRSNFMLSDLDNKDKKELKALKPQLFELTLSSHLKDAPVQMLLSLYKKTKSPAKKQVFAEVIATSPKAVISFVRNIAPKRWPLAEKYLVKHPQEALQYMEELKRLNRWNKRKTKKAYDRWPEFEAAWADIESSPKLGTALIDYSEHIEARLPQEVESRLWKTGTTNVHSLYKYWETWVYPQPVIELSILLINHLQLDYLVRYLAKIKQPVTLAIEKAIAISIIEALQRAQSEDDYWPVQNGLSGFTVYNTTVDAQVKLYILTIEDREKLSKSTYEWARITGKRWPEAEKHLFGESLENYLTLFKSNFTEAEAVALLQDPDSALQYAMSRRVRIPKFESTYAKDSKRYLFDIFSATWPSAEAYLEDESVANYIEHYGYDRWPEKEEHLLKTMIVHNLVQYHYQFFTARWPQLEKVLLEKFKAEPTNDVVEYWRSVIAWTGPLRWPEFENLLLSEFKTVGDEAGNNKVAYATNYLGMIQQPWPEAFKKALYAINGTSFVITYLKSHPAPVAMAKVEAALAKRAESALSYATFIGKRFLLGESTIIKNLSIFQRYVDHIIEKEEPDLEKYIAESSAETVFTYIQKIRKRFLAGEKLMFSKICGDSYRYHRHNQLSPEFQVNYIKHFLKERSVAIEEALLGRMQKALSNESIVSAERDSVDSLAKIAINYVKYAIQGPWPEAEPLILKSKFRYKYLHEFTKPADEHYQQLEQEVDFDKLIEKTRDLRSKGLIRRWRQKRVR